MKKRFLAALLAAGMVGSMLTGCSSSSNTETTAAAGTTAAGSEAAATSGAASDSQYEATTITVFAAKSLNGAMDEIIKMYNEKQPNVTIQPSYDSSGTLLTQIEEGAACDVFFSAAQKQMDTLQNDDKLVVDGTRYNVVNNQVCVVTPKDSGTKVTGLDNIKDAKSFALADGSVPVGKYTRQALVNAGMLDKVDDVSTITTQQVSEALGGIEINECANVGAVTAAIAEGSNEVGTVYYSDIYGMDDKIDIIEKISYDLTGDVIYPIAQVVNKEASQLQQEVAKNFIDFVMSDEAKAVFDKYQFDTNVQN